MSPDARRLAGRTVGAGLWTVGTRLLAKLIDLALLICLARFLDPSAFALVATAMALVLVVEALFELPMAAALIRAPELDAPLLDTAFTLGLLRGVGIAALLLALAWPLAALNDDPRLLPLLAALALAPAVRGLISPRMVEFTRRMEFRPDALLELSGKLVAFVVAVSLAASTHSHWALAAATISAPITGTALSYVVAPLRPRLDLSRWPHFSDIVGWSLLSQLANAFNWQIDRLLLPHYIAPTAFGTYAMAKQISEIPQQALLSPLQRPLMAALSSPSADHRRHYLHAVRAIVLVIAPALVVLVACPEPLVLLALGPKWLPAADSLRLLAAICLLVLPTVPMGTLAMLLHRSRIIGVVTTATVLVKIPLVVIGAARYGIPGAIAGSAIAQLLGTTLAMLAVRALIGIGLRRQWSALLIPLLALLPGAMLLAAADAWICAAPHWLLLLPRLALLACAYLLLYVLGVLLAWQLQGRPPGLERHLVDVVLRRLDHLRSRHVPSL